MSEEKRVYWCVICGRAIERDEYGLFIHDDIVHPPEMDFSEEDRPQ